MRFIGIDEAKGRRLLASVGVEWHAIGQEGSDAETEVIEAVLPEGERQVRGTFDAEPPAAGEEHLAHCAWHRNSVDEGHTFNSGLGIFEFWTQDGPVTVVSEAGDLMVNRRAEHRFRPVTTQQLRLRHSGPVDGGFGYVATVRDQGAWPSID
jgi:hypothetical protein